MTDDEVFGGLEDKVVIVDVQATLARATESHRAQNPNAPEVTEGNCDVAFGYDVMRPGALKEAFAPRDAESAREDLLRRGLADEPFAVRGSASGTLPDATSVTRRDDLRALVGLSGLTFSGKGVSVAVVDAGASLGHPALAGGLDPDQICHLDGGCSKGAPPHNVCLGAECATCDHPNECNHGTAMASAIGGRTPSSAAEKEEAIGLFYAPEATMKLVRVLGQGAHDGGGSAIPIGETSRVLRVLAWLATRTTPAQLPVVYLGFSADPVTSKAACERSGPLRMAVEKLAKDRIVVAPAGNDGIAEISAPACFDGVISVAAWGRVADAAHADAPEVAAAWSNGAASADVLAPGEDIPVASSIDLADGSARAKSDYAWSNGTSVAAAQVAGAMALAVEAKGVDAMLAKSEAERVACIASGSASPPRLNLTALARCP